MGGWVGGEGGERKAAGAERTAAGVERKAAGGDLLSHFGKAWKTSSLFSPTTLREHALRKMGIAVEMISPSRSGAERTFAWTAVRATRLANGKL